MKKVINAIIGLCLIAVFLALSACSNRGTVDFSKYEKVLLDASWAYNYESIRELADNCDLAAYIKVTGMTIDDKYKSYGVYLTVFTAEIQESLYGKRDETIRIVMTGKIDEKENKIYEIADDPLMKIGDEFFVFARINEDGTYTILSGPQGRFAIVDDLVYSLNVYDEQVAKNNLGSNITVKKQPKEDFYAQINEFIANRNKV